MLGTSASGYYQYTATKTPSLEIGPSPLLANSATQSIRSSRRKSQGFSVPACSARKPTQLITRQCSFHKLQSSQLVEEMAVLTSFLPTNPHPQCGCILLTKRITTGSLRIEWRPSISCPLVESLTLWETTWCAILPATQHTKLNLRSPSPQFLQ